MAIGRDFGDILRNQGYIADNELGIQADIRQALSHHNHIQPKAGEDFKVAYIDLHMINMGVLPAIKPQVEIDQLRVLIAATKARASQQNKKQTILLVSNNGGGHFVTTEIAIAVDGSATVCVIDSKTQANALNNVVLNHALEAARDAQCLNPTGQIIYRSVQGHDANCPFWVMNYIAQRIEGGVVVNQPLTSGNIQLVKLAGLKNIIQTKRDANAHFPLQAADVAIDAEFGTAYMNTDAGRSALAQYKAQRHAVAGHVVAAASTSTTNESWKNTVRMGVLDAAKKREVESKGEKTVQYRPGFFVTERTQIAADEQLARATQNMSDREVKELTEGFKL